MKIVDGELIVTYTDGVTDNLGSISSGTTQPTPTVEYLKFSLLDDGTYLVSVNDSYKDMVTNIVIPETYNGISVTTIKYNGFRDCKLLSSVFLPDSIKKIENGAFYGCSSLTAVDIPDSVISIGWSCFNGCTSLTTLRLSDSITEIQDKLCYNCSSMSQFIIPEGVTKIGGDFLSGTKVKEITIPKNVTAINGSSFPDTLIKAYFQKTEGWTRASGYLGSSWAKVNASLLADPAKAAELLKEKDKRSEGNYLYYWKN